jgi:F-type H+-transporting ATPase subunit b
VIPPFDLGPVANHYPKAFLALIVGFALLVLLVVKFVLPGLKTMLRDRETRIETAHNQVQAALSDVKHLRDDYAVRIARIEAEARERIDAAVREAEAVREEIIAEAQNTAVAINRRTQEELARERNRQRLILRRQLVESALNAAEQSIVATNSDSTQRELIKDFTAQVKTTTGRTA